jgi:hypothetical protein
MERVEAHRILTEHAPERDPRWVWLRDRCSTCHRRYPCMLRDGALVELAAGIRDRLAPEPSWLRLFHRAPSSPNTARWSS